MNLYQSHQIYDKDNLHKLNRVTSLLQADYNTNTIHLNFPKC